MPYVKIEMFTGRTREQKAALVRAVTDAFVAHAGSKPEDVQIVIQDVAKSDWATAGTLADERDKKKSP